MIEIAKEIVGIAKEIAKKESVLPIKPVPASPGIPRKKQIAPRKCTDEQHMFILRMHAEGHTKKEVQKELKERDNLTLSVEGITNVCKAKKNQTKLEYFRNQYLADVRKVPIANKRFRLDDKEYLRKRIIKTIQANPMITKEQKDEFLAFANRLNQLHSETREEMEKKPHLFGEIIGAMREFSDGDLKQRKRELILKYRDIRGDFEENGRDRLTRTDTDSGDARQKDNA